jgi:hypothetical protein
MGEAKRRELARRKVGAELNTYAGKIHVEWDPQAAVTPLGQLPFFIEFLKVSGLFDAFVDECPLKYSSPNAPDKRDILGTLMLSILAGHKRYAHISAIRCDGVNPELLGMEKIVSEDAARRALLHIGEQEGIEWLETQLTRSTMPVLSAVSGPSWILDTDTTVKCLYGRQEGAVRGYNPKKPGRPSHSYHSYFMANTGLALKVEVKSGNETASNHTTAGLWQLLESIPERYWPAFIRGDAAFGVEGVLSEAEARGVHYLTKLRLTKNVRRLIEKLFEIDDWVDAGQGYQGTESSLQLSGWSRSRRVIVLRRFIAGDILFKKETEKDQLDMIFLETECRIGKYEYSVLVTSLPDDIFSLAQHYRDRACCENSLDELKNQWGWGGYTTKDIKRCRLISRMVALIYNWWSLFVRLANPDKHHEAITSRPLLLHAVAKKTSHGGQTFLTITNHHAKAEKVRIVLRNLSQFLGRFKVIAEQLNISDRVRLIALYAFRKLISQLNLKPVCLIPKFDT